MTQSRGARALMALAAGVLSWNLLLQFRFFTGGAAMAELVVITAVAVVVTVVVFRGPRLRALIALAAGMLAWRALLELLLFNEGTVNFQLVVITAVAAAFALVVFHALPKTQTFGVD